MRVTDSLQTNTLMNNVETSLSNYNLVQQQISTGKKLNHLSDDPIGGSQDMAIQASLVDNAQYQNNADAATSFLSATDSTLTSANNLMQSAKQIAVQGANGTLSSDDRQSLADQVDGVIRQLTQLANTDLHGKYLFGGTQTQTAPYVAPTTGSDPTPTYVGNSGSVTATLGKNDSIALNSGGTATFGASFSALQSLRTDLASGDQTAISADIDKVSSSMTAMSSQQAMIGARMNEVSDTKANLTRASTDYKSSVSDIEDVDLAQAYVQLQSTQNVYQASLVAVNDSFKFSLAQYLT